MSEWEETTGVANAVELSEDSGFERNRPCLVVLSGMHLGQTFTIDRSKQQTVGRSRRSSIRLVDDGVSRQHVSITADQSGALWLDDLQSRNGTFCNGRRISKHQLRDGDKIQFGRSTMLRFTYLDAHDEGFQRLMYDSALRDGLTRAFNRRYFSDRLASEFRFAQRHRTTLSVLIFDIDHFKDTNERHGHVAGDFALTEIADLIQMGVRSEDVLARLGGDEFALITRSVALENSSQLAERLRRSVADMVLEYQSKPIALTVSVGLVSYPDTPHTSPDDLLKAADRALHAAKQRGRNCCVVYRPEFADRAGTEGDDLEFITAPE